MERSEFQRCGYTVRELEDRYGHNPTDECQFCAKNNISCLVLNHGATPEGVDQRRASQGHDTALVTRIDQMEKSLSILTADFNLQTFDIWTEGGRSAVEQTEFKNAVIKFYKRNPFYTNKIRCMVTGVLQDRDLVIASHIWKQCKHGVGLPKFGLSREDSKNPRNGLLLLRDIELKFDVKEVCFVYHPLSKYFCVKVLNPALLPMVIANSGGKTFGDINDQPLQHPRKNFPFRRLLSFHAQCSYKAAVEKRWITQQDFDNFAPFHTLSDSASVH